MDVQLVNSATIRGGTPPSGQPTIPLTAFDKLAADMHVCVLFAFAAPTSTNEDIKDALAKTLLHFYTLAGKLSVDHLGRHFILLSDGALVLETKVNSVLSKILPFCPSPELQKLHPPVEGVKKALQIQLNRFSCGGLVVGVTSHHRVVDGQSMSCFFSAWGKSLKGLPVDPLPVYDFSTWLKPRREPVMGGELTPPPRSPPPLPPPEEDVFNVSLHFSSEFITQGLKARMTEKYTTFESLLGHLWRKITAARRLAGGVVTEARVAVDGRRRVSPPIPREFTGNMVVNARPRATATELAEEGLEGAVERIHASIKGTGEESFRAVVDFGEIHKDEEEMLVKDAVETELYPDVEVNSWLGFRFDDAEFGGCAASAFAPSWIPAEGVLVLVPSREGDGGVDVIVTLFESHANLLRKISHSLD